MNISLTAQTGGLDAGQKFRKEIVILRKALKLLENNNYSPFLEKVKVFIRIGGKIEDYKGLTGIHKSRYMKKSKSYSSEIIISLDFWKKKSNIKTLLCEFILEYFSTLNDYLMHKKIDLNYLDLIKDLKEIVLKTFVENKIKD